MALTKRMVGAVSDFAALPQSDYVEGRALAAGVAERIAIPVDANGVKARYVLYSFSDHFCAKAGNSTVTAAMPTDTVDGSASELNPTFRVIDPSADVTHISVIATNACVGTMSFLLPTNPSGS